MMVAPHALRPRCHDDDTDLRQILFAFVPDRMVPAKKVTCASINTLSNGSFCTVSVK